MLLFIPNHDSSDYCSHDGYETCAAAIRQHIDMRKFGTLPNSKPFFPCYFKTAAEIARLMKETPDMESCTNEFLIDQLKVKNLVNMDATRFVDVEQVQFHIGSLLEAMTLLSWKYNFLWPQMRCKSDSEDHQPAKSPRQQLQQLGLFEENSLNAAQSQSVVFKAELLHVSFLCDVLGVDICWVMNLGEHLVFDGARRQLKLFRLPSFCEIVGPGSFLSRQVIR